MYSIDIVDFLYEHLCSEPSTRLTPSSPANRSDFFSSPRFLITKLMAAARKWLVTVATRCQPTPPGHLPIRCRFSSGPMAVCKMSALEHSFLQVSVLSSNIYWRIFLQKLREGMIIVAINSSLSLK